MKSDRDPRHGPNTTVIIAFARIVPIQVRLPVVAVPVEVRHPAHKHVVISHARCMIQSQPNHDAKGTPRFLMRDPRGGICSLKKWIETRLIAWNCKERMRFFFDLTCSGSPSQDVLLFAVQ